MGNLRFIDSCQFLNTSLKTLVNNVSAEGKSKFQHLSSEFISQLLIYKRRLTLCLQGLSAAICKTLLLSQKDFYSELTDEHISDENYQHTMYGQTLIAKHCKMITAYI